MIKFNLKSIASILNAESFNGSCIIQTISIDSRVIPNNHCLFIALKGKKFDSHDFISQAIANGARALLVNRRFPLDIPQLIVSDTHRALGQIGSWIRQQVKTRIIALTGSSGKTSVREMTTSILMQCGQVLATKNNENNEIGVPLTLLRLTPQDDFAIIELGANNFNEISLTSNFVRPEIVLINNIHSSHLSGFGSLAGCAKAKGEIFLSLKQDGRAIINADSHDWIRWKKVIGHKIVWRFSLKSGKDVDFFASDIHDDQFGIRFRLHTPQGDCTVHHSLLGQHNISNALAASALSLSVGATLSEISTGLSQMKAIPERLFPISLGIGHLLINDSYNANVGSMIAAIRVLSKMPGYQVMVVGDMSELGNHEVELHHKIGKIISSSSINKVLSIGNLSHIISDSSGRGEHFENKDSIIVRLITLLSEYSVITVLIKGSRNASMNKIILELQERISC